MLGKIKHSNLFIKVTNWEYWPVWLAYLPVLPVVLFYVAKSRRWFFFSNVNPLFKTGALLGASKYKILSQIPGSYKPVTLYVSKETNDLVTVLKGMDEVGLSYPIIAKPDVGERGLLVALIKTENELKAYLKANKIDILIQEFVDLKHECGIFYVRKPSEDKGQVVSIGLKAFIELKGDGHSTVRSLMQKNPHTKLQIERLEEEGAEVFLSNIPAEGEHFGLDPIGNHCRGACFLDGNHLICDKLNRLFNEINSHMTEVYYGRFDVKYDTWEQLLEGKNVKILEMNGIASEPIHIYDKNVGIKDKYKSFYSLWKTIYEISDIQTARGIQPISIKMAFKAFREYKEHINSLNANWKNASTGGFSLS
jgi:hypothetical protein